MCKPTNPAAATIFSRLPPSVPQANDPVFDQAAALALVDGDELFLCELANLFVQEQPERLAALEAALAAEALAEVERLAHNLKGAACHFAAALTVAAAQWLET